MVHAVADKTTQTIVSLYKSTLGEVIICSSPIYLEDNPKIDIIRNQLEKAGCTVRYHHISKDNLNLEELTKSVNHTSIVYTNLEPTTVAHITDITQAAHAGGAVVVSGGSVGLKHDEDIAFSIDYDALTKNLSEKAI